MSIVQEYIKVNTLISENYDVFVLDIQHSSPTPLQWEVFKQKLINTFENSKQLNKKFAFLINAKKIGLISLEKIKEFISILDNNSQHIEKYCICSTVIIEGVVIESLLALFLKFYNTKKPLFFYKNNADCIKKIEEVYNNKNLSDKGVDLNSLEYCK